ncbi:Rossmann-fold NAD(P)-binding domain-containing protein [Flindersiella endophytica]
MTILVTGATGNVGRHLVALLADEGADVRAVSRNPSTAKLPSGVEVVAGDTLDPKSLEPALATDVDTVFLLWPAMTGDGVEPVVDAIARHAKRVVYLSALGASGFYAGIERLLEQTGLDYTFLRAGGFATNTLGWAAAIRANEVVRLPYAQAARSLVHEYDLAAVAARTLTEGGHSGAAYDLTGPEVLTQADQLRVIGEVTGKRVLWQEIPRDVARREMIEEGWPEAFADSGLDHWKHIVAHPEPVTTDVEQVTGVPARTFRQWVEDHADAFR